MIFVSEGAPSVPLAVARSVGAERRGLPDLVPESPAAHPLISQGVVVQPGISGRVLSRDEIALLRDIAICEFRVSFRGTPAY
jgi:hypothetical protein